MFQPINIYSLKSHANYLASWTLSRPDHYSTINRSHATSRTTKSCADRLMKVSEDSDDTRRLQRRPTRSTFTILLLLAGQL